MNNIEFRKLLARLLSDKNAFYGDNVGSFEDETYKINYQIIQKDTTEKQITYQIEIDVWCKSTVEKETICDDIEKKLNYTSHDGARFINIGVYNADEKNIYRTTLRYEVRTWERG